MNTPIFFVALVRNVVIVIVCAVAMTVTPVGHAADTDAGVPEPLVVRVGDTAPVVKKLNEIKIKEINFQNADINAIIDFLVDESRRIDPEGTGVNIIVREVPAGRQICSLRLRDIKLIDVIKVIVDLANMRYVVEPKAVVIVPADSSYGLKFETRTFPIHPSLIGRLVVPLGGAAPPLPVFDPLGGAIVPPVGGGFGQGGGINVDSAQLVNLFETLGVSFPRGANVHYLPSVNRLVATNTVQNLEAFERLLNELSI